MSVLKKIVGAVMSGKGGNAGLAALAMQNPKLVQGVMGLLASDSAVGGLPGMVAVFDKAGLADAVASWLGEGANKPVSGGDIRKALGGPVLDQLSAQANMSTNEASGALAQLLPAMIDRLSPKGQAQALDIGQVKSLLGGFVTGKA